MLIIIIIPGIYMAFHLIFKARKDKPL